MDHDNVLLEQEINRIAGETDGRLSFMASGLKGSEILKIATDIRNIQTEGTEICNLTVGDFSPAQFRIPRLLEDSIKDALTKGETNYPPTDGLGELKKSVQELYRQRLNLDYPIESIIITSGSRPGIYGTYNTVVDPGDTVVYPVPSWNNNHYCHITRAVGKAVVCVEKDAFLPTASLIKDAVKVARLITLNSPLNPTGTAFRRAALEEICDLVLEENKERKKTGRRPLYVLYDQVYWTLTFGATEHVNPVSLRPEMVDYTILVDGISKAFAATGVRVGWALGPRDIIQRMVSLLAHVGAWAPRAEQVATAKFLSATSAVMEANKTMKAGLQQRLDVLYTGITTLREQGFPVNAITPMGAMYLSVQFGLMGKRTASGALLTTNEDIRQYLLQGAQLGVVPFQAFGSKENTGWCRLSVGTVSVQEIQNMFGRLKAALARLT
jgi:aspartate aminotransferase